MSEVPLYGSKSVLPSRPGLSELATMPMDCARATRPIPLPNLWKRFYQGTTRWSTRVLTPWNSAGYVTKFSLQKVLELIV